MIEIAICLAIIGFALVAIIGVLPLGMNTQRDNREETIINQDATVLLEAIRSAARGADDLTNSVFAITNYVTTFNNSGQPVNVNNPDVYGYTFTAASINGTANSYNITNAYRIIGLLSTPEYTDGVRPIPNVIFGGYSNHVVAYVRAISGLAAEKPPQDNQIMREDALTYRLYCVNAPMPVDTNLFYLYPGWQPQVYPIGTKVFYRWNYWQASAATVATDEPGLSAVWVKNPNYAFELAANQRELRLSFLWPVLPNGKIGNGRQSFRATIAGQLMPTNNFGQTLYFYQSQSFRTNS
jgi:type II secretory pathway pseudopilin PulG